MTQAPTTGATGAPQSVPTPVPSVEAAAVLAEALRAAGLNEQSVLEVFGVQTPEQVRAMPTQVRMMKTSQETPLNVMIRMFLMGVAASPATASKATGPRSADDWVALGLFRKDQGQYRATVQLYLAGDLLIASDMPVVTAGRVTMPRDAVMGVLQTTLDLSAMMIRRHVGSVLDLGCGAGLLALQAAGFATSVVAADINPRAAAFVRFNAALAGKTNVEAVAGDRFAPVQGRTFDLIIANPPYVISPESRFTFRDSGMKLDAFCRSLAEKAGTHLNPGGHFQMFCDFAHVSGENPAKRVASWFAGSGCDVVVSRLSTLPPRDYAEHWCRMTGAAANQQEFMNRLGSWLQYYQSERVEAITHALVTMRRPSPGAADAPVAGDVPDDGRAPWIRFDEIPDRVQGSAGEQIARGFTSRDFLRRTGDEALLAASMVAAPELRLAREVAPSEHGSWSDSAFQARLSRGFPFAATLQHWEFVALSEAGAGKPLSSALEAAAKAAGKSADELRTAFLGAVRQFVEVGALIPKA